MVRYATLVFLLSAGALAQVAGKVTRAVGPASIERSSRTIAAAPDVKVNWNDVLKTDQDGRERVVLGDGSILMLTSNATMKVVNHDEKSGKTQLELSYGYVRATVVGVAQGSTPQFEIRTSTALCGVLGTQFELETSDEATQVHVHEGQVHFTNSRTGQRMELQRGQSAHLLHRQGAMRQGLYPKFAARTRQRWQQDREEIQQERVERNQARQERARQERQKQKGEKAHPKKKK